MGLYNGLISGRNYPIILFPFEFLTADRWFWHITCCLIVAVPFRLEMLWLMNWKYDKFDICIHFNITTCVGEWIMICFITNSILMLDRLVNVTIQCTVKSLTSCRTSHTMVSKFTLLFVSRHFRVFALKLEFVTLWFIFPILQFEMEYLLFLVVLAWAFVFSALLLLVRQQKGCLVCKNWVMRYLCGYLSGARCKWFVYGPADATATLSFFVKLKSGMVYFSGAGLPRLSWKKALNGCSVV